MDSRSEIVRDNGLLEKLYCDCLFSKINFSNKFFRKYLKKSKYQTRSLKIVKLIFWIVIKYPRMNFHYCRLDLIIRHHSFYSSGKSWNVIFFLINDNYNNFKFFLPNFVAALLGSVARCGDFPPNWRKFWAHCQCLWRIINMNTVKPRCNALTQTSEKVGYKRVWHFSASNHRIRRLFWPFFSAL